MGCSQRNVAGAEEEERGAERNARMLMHPTLEKLKNLLQLRGMAAGLEDQLRTAEIDSLSFEERLGLLLDREEILDDRYGARSTLITSQLPIPAWHDYLADPTLADAILDRFIHNAHHLDLRGDSMRKTKSTLTRKDPISEG